MDDISKRIKQQIDVLGISARELSRRAGLPTETHVSALLKRGAAKAEVETLRSIAKGLGVSESWLMTGDGEVSGSANDTGTKSEPVPTHEPIPETLGGMRNYDAQERRARKELRAAGEDVEEWVWAHVRNTNVFATANGAPAVSMLKALAKVIQDHGDPSVKPRGNDS